MEVTVNAGWRREWDKRGTVRVRLAGDLQAMPLAELLSWVARGAKTGTLHLHRGPTRKLIVFQGGVLQSCSSNDAREKLGDFLVRRRLITEGQLQEALARQEQNGIMLGILLVAEGRITAGQLSQTLRAKAEEIVYEALLWDEGGVQFREGELPASVPIHLNLDTLAVVREGLRRRETQAAGRFA